MNEYVVEQGRITGHWKICFSQLASLANGAIKNVPKLLADVESAIFLTHLRGLKLSSTTARN